MIQLLELLADGRGEKTEGRRQRAEGRGQKKCGVVKMVD